MEVIMRTAGNNVTHASPQTSLLVVKAGLFSIDQ